MELEATCASWENAVSLCVCVRACRGRVEEGFLGRRSRSKVAFLAESESEEPLKGAEAESRDAEHPQLFKIFGAGCIDTMSNLADAVGLRMGRELGRAGGLVSL